MQNSKATHKRSIRSLQIYHFRSPMLPFKGSRMDAKSMPLLLWCLNWKMAHSLPILIQSPGQRLPLNSMAYSCFGYIFTSLLRSRMISSRNKKPESEVHIDLTPYIKQAYMIQEFKFITSELDLMVLCSLHC